MFKTRLYVTFLFLVNLFVMSSQVFAGANQRRGIFTYITYIVGFAMILLLLYMIYAWFVNTKVSKKTAEVSIALEHMSSKDSTWDQEKLIDLVGKVFYEIQAGIADRDIVALSMVTHPILISKWSTQIQNAPEGDLTNIKNKQIQDISIVDADDYADDEKDSFTACIDINSNEYTVDKHGLLIFPKDATSLAEKEITITEYWKFEKEQGEWKLLDVERSSHWKESVDNSVISEE